MSQYTSITIIYNPNSTGSGERLAKTLRKKLETTMPRSTVDIIATEHAGHGEELAFELATASRHPLIISASGDGGYHEVINGLIKAQAKGSHPVGGLLPAGNANDHYHSLHDIPVAQAIRAGQEQAIDLIKLSTTIGGKPFERYAHSYIGVGLTPKVGTELNKTKLNMIKEMWIVLKVLFLLKPVRLEIDGEKRAYDSLIFSNIEKMSKVLHLSEAAKVDDGKFEVTAFHRRNKFALISALLKATVTGLKSTEQISTFSFKTYKPTLVQLDGEIQTIDSGAKVTIELEPRLLRCII
jgi:diacylglycerol kinase (ATP)